MSHLRTAFVSLLVCCCFIATINNASASTAIDRRIELEAETASNPFVITPHKPNYILPFSYNHTPGPMTIGSESVTLDRQEMKFQFSFKVLVYRNILVDRLNLYFGYTSLSFWQAFNAEISAPFRDTNHEPELMLTYYRPFTLGDLKVHGATFGFNHQSNGRSAQFSRSWNRLYLQSFAEYHDWYFELKPWYRLPEPQKADLNDIKGDDNPDIEYYLGHFEFRAMTFYDNNSFDMMWRNNLRSDNRGAVELGWTFPISHRLRGYTQIFHGYGEGLLDYNVSSSRVSFGIMMTNWL
jgi:phospholipase A1